MSTSMRRLLLAGSTFLIALAFRPAEAQPNPCQQQCIDTLHECYFGGSENRYVCVDNYQRCFYGCNDT